MAARDDLARQAPPTMIELAPLAALGAGVILALLIGAAAWVLRAGLTMRAEARGAQDRLRAAEGLLNGSPTLAMTVRGDGHVEVPDRLVDWLGLSRHPRFLAELSEGEDGAGLDGVEAAALVRDVAATQKSGRPFVRALRAIGSRRAMLVRGQRLAGDAGGVPGRVVLWWSDATDAQTEIERLSGEATRLEGALAAVSGLIEAAPLPMWHRGPDLRLTTVNTAYVAAVEATSASEVVRRQLELVETSGAGGPVAAAERARAKGEVVDRAVPATIGGERRMLRVVDVPLGENGVAGYAIDVEELEGARAALRRFREAQRDMLDRMSAGFAQFAPDRSLVYSNQPFRHLFAMRPEWLSDRPTFDRVLDRMREGRRLPDVRDFPAWKEERRGWFTSHGEAVEEQWLLVDGTHLRVVAQPLPEGGLLLIFEDRTEQVQLASARDTLLRVRTATFDNLFEALGVFAADGRLQIWNRRFREVWGLEEEMLARHPRVDTLAQAVAAKLTSPPRARLIGELVRAATVDRQQRGGRVAFVDGRHFEFAAVPLPDGNALFTMLDVTDSRRIERALRDRNEALEEGDRVKTAFVASMSYELRTPLTSIAGFAEMLDAGYAGTLPRTAHEYVTAILESVARLGGLVDNVLDLTQGDAGALPIEIAEVDVATIAAEAGDAVIDQVNAVGAELVRSIDPETGVVRGDAKRLRQAVEHLLRHAIQGIGDGRRILLHADGGAERVRIIVSDDGPGMSAAAAAKAFDRFAQGSDRGMGLGLPLARQFVEAHGGTVSLVSEPGEGTLMTIELPRG